MNKAINGLFILICSIVLCQRINAGQAWFCRGNGVYKTRDQKIFVNRVVSAMNSAYEEAENVAHAIDESGVKKIAHDDKKKIIKRFSEHYGSFAQQLPIMLELNKLNKSYHEKIHEINGEIEEAEQLSKRLDEYTTTKELLDAIKRFGRTMLAKLARLF